MGWCHANGTAMLKRSFRTLFLVILGWVFLNLGLVAAAWSRAYFADIDPIPQTIALDLRTDTAQAGRIVTLIATKPTPAKADYIGHMWVAWPQTPPLAPKGSTEGGYYAKNQGRAAGLLAIALLAPWGFVTGQVADEGLMKVDDGWWRHVQVQVRVNEDRYQAALAVDSRWRRETRYRLRPGVRGLADTRLWACQDYVLDVADALGLKGHPRDWTQFPMGSFLDFAKANDIKLSHRAGKD